MARSLPFEVQPTARFQAVGDEAAGNGVLRFRVKGTVSIAERLEVAEADRSNEIFRTTGELSNRIAKERGHDPTAVYMALRSLLEKLDSSTFPPLDALEGEIALGYTDEVHRLHRERTANNEAVIIRQATVMIRRRLQGCEDWTDADTAELDSEQLIVQIAMLYRSEMLAGAGGSTAIEDTARQLEELREALGKLQTEAGGPPPPTGDGSTGSADTTTPAPTNSDPTASPTTPSSTSPKRSKPRSGGSSSGFTTKDSASPS